MHAQFGGGFVIVSLMKKKFVEELQWLEEDEMLDVTAITQSAPGPLPVNASVIIGYRIAGVIGSLTAILGTILPPMIIISIISLFYEQFRTNPYISTALQVMRAGVAAVIFDVVINLAGNVIKTKRILYISMMIIAFVATYPVGCQRNDHYSRLSWNWSAGPCCRNFSEKEWRDCINVIIKIIFCFHTSWNVQCRRWICCYSTDSGTDCQYLRVNDTGRIFRFDHGCRDDTGNRFPSIQQRS